MLGLNETIDQLAMVNSVHRYGHVLRREDGHVLRTLRLKNKREAKEDMETASWG